MKKFFYAIFPLAALLLLTTCEEELPNTMGNIYGIVGDMETGEPVKGASVILSPGNRTTVTGSDGHFEFLNLEAAQYKIQVSASGYVTNSRQITVLAGSSTSGDIMLRQTTAQMSVSTEKLDFGSNEKSLSFDVITEGDRQVEWTVKENIDWLSCSPESGKVTNASASVIVTVSRDGLEEGSYREVLIVSSKDEKVSDQTVVIEMQVSKNKLQVTPSELDFGTNETSLPLTLKNTGMGTLDYTVSSSNDWLVPSKTSGTITDSGNINAVISRTGLAVASYTATLTFTFEGGSVNIPVTMEVEELKAPIVSLESQVTGIGYNRATVRGMIADVGSSKVTRYGFCWAEQAEPTVDMDKVNLGDCTEPKSFEAVITGLQPNTLYYLRAYAENSTGITYSGNEITFTTYDAPMMATVVTGEVSNVSNVSATVNGSITNLGNVEKLSAYGHVWGTSPTPTIEGDEHTDFGSLNEIKTFTSTLYNLEEETTYYVRAYATNEMGTAYGDIVEFTTERTPVDDVVNGLYVYYTFEGDTKTIVDGGYNATAINNPTYVDGINGTKAIKFSTKNNSHISIPEPMIDNATYSVSFWIKGVADGPVFHVPSSGHYDTSFDFIMKDGAFAYTTSGYTMAYDYSNIKKFSHSSIGSSGWTMVTLTSTITTGTGNTTVKLYLNGEFVDVINEENAAFRTVGYGLKFVFGGKMEYYNVSLNAPSMTVDNLRIYNTRALSDAEVEQIYKYESQ